VAARRVMHAFGKQERKAMFKIKISLVALMALILTVSAQAAENGYIQVKSQSGVTVFLDGTMKGVTSDDVGGLIISEVPAGRHDIKAIREGYRPKTDTIVVESGKVAVFEIGTFTPKINVTQSGKSSETAIKKRIGSLKIQSLPIDCRISIPELGLKELKAKDEWVASGIPVGEYQATFSAIGKDLDYRLTIVENQQLHLMVDFVKRKVQDLTLRLFGMSYGVNPL